MFHPSSSRSLSTVLVSENLGVAFACVIGAALATCVGAAAVFFPRLVKLANRKVLAGSLSFAAGVMIYVSFLDIFAKAYDGFTEAGNDHAIAYLYSTLTFFGGSAIVIIYQIIDKKFLHAGEEEHEQMEQIIAQNELGQQAEVHVESQQSSEEEKMQQTMHSDDSTDSNNSSSHSGAAVASELERKSLYRMGTKTAIAISFHNFPEGLATFVGYVADPAIGVSLAIAIAFHNIPEGLCVALPIYYATGSRWKGFGMAALSSLAEFLGGFFGWLVLANSMTDTAYAVLFGIVGGMMVTISITDLLPTASFYDPKNSVLPYAFVIGMAFMSISLVLLQF